MLREAAKLAGVVIEGVNILELNYVADYRTEKIDFSLLNNENYVGVDNLLVNKKGKTVSNYVPVEGNFKKFIKDDILIGNIRPYLRKIWFADRMGGTNGDVLVIKVNKNFNNNLDSRFLYYILASEGFFVYNEKFSRGAKMPRGNKIKIMEYKIPVPSLAVQRYVVSILDRFDSLVNDISQGLPKEIELRQKQYEYFREKLLSFKS